MRYLAQALVVGVIALFTIAIFAPAWIAPRSADSRPTDLAANANVGSPAEVESISDEVAVEAASEESSGTAVPPARTKLVQSLKSAAQVIDEKIPGNGDVSITSQIVDTLDQADRILSDAQIANRQSIASVSRQVRLPGRSPPLLVVVVPGLERSHVDKLDKVAHPALSRLQTEGALVAGLRSIGAATTPSIQTIAYAGPIDVSSQAIPPSLMSMLWHSGYDTTVVGDLSWTAATEPAQVARHGIDQSFGLKTATEVAEAFPKHVWSNDLRVRIPANESAEQVSADQIFVNEAALKVVGTSRNHRPQAVILTLPSSNEMDAAARSDQVVASLLKKFDEKRSSDRTLLVVIGLPSATGVAVHPVALVRWPRNISAGKVIEQECDAMDLAPTILSLTQSQRVSNSWPGTSRADTWRSNTTQVRDVMPATKVRDASTGANTGNALPEA
jgi:hypothetical protein